MRAASPPAVEKPSGFALISRVAPAASPPGGGKSHGFAPKSRAVRRLRRPAGGTPRVSLNFSPSTVLLLLLLLDPNSKFFEKVTKWVQNHLFDFSRPPIDVKFYSEPLGNSKKKIALKTKTREKMKNPPNSPFLVSKGNLHFLVGS